VTHFYIFEADEARHFKFFCQLNAKSTGVTHVKVLQYVGAFRSRDLSKISEIRTNIAKTVQDRDIVTMEG